MPYFDVSNSKIILNNEGNTHTLPHFCTLKIQNKLIYHGECVGTIDITGAVHCSAV